MFSLDMIFLSLWIFVLTISVGNDMNGKTIHLLSFVWFIYKEIYLIHPLKKYKKKWYFDKIYFSTHTNPFFFSF